MTGEEIKIIWLTLRVATISTVAILPLALWLGWILARKNIPGKPVIEAAISLPLVAPPVVTGYILLILLGRNGFIGNWLYNWFGIRLTFNLAALIIASSVVSLPLAVRSIRSAFELIDPCIRKSIPDTWRITSGNVFQGEPAHGVTGCTERHGSFICTQSGRIRSKYNPCRKYRRKNTNHFHHGIFEHADTRNGRAGNASCYYINTNIICSYCRFRNFE